MEWISSAQAACSGFMRTLRKVVIVGRSRWTVRGRVFSKKASGSSARARWRFFLAATSKIWRLRVEISEIDVGANGDCDFGFGATLQYVPRQFDDGGEEWPPTRCATPVAGPMSSPAAVRMPSARWAMSAVRWKSCSRRRASASGSTAPCTPPEAAGRRRD